MPKSGSYGRDAEEETEEKKMLQLSQILQFTNYQTAAAEIATTQPSTTTAATTVNIKVSTTISTCTTAKAKGMRYGKELHAITKSQPMSPEVYAVLFTVVRV